MDVDHLPQPSSSNEASHDRLDLIGGPFAVIESDPGVFTALTRKIGIQNVELVEMYDIEPWAVDHLNPYGLIFCFLWHKDSHRPGDFEDPASERVWFANQLSDDACASLAILNVVLNCPNIDIGDDLRAFKRDTEEMSSVMKGLAISSFPMLRKAHNSLARPADLRGALNAIATTTTDAEKAKVKRAKQKPATKRDAKPPPAKRAKLNKRRKSIDSDTDEADDVEGEGEETYHFIGYVPAYGKVWELDGLKSGPLEVGELPSLNGPSGSGYGRDQSSSAAWMDVVRPALRMKMEKYGGSAEGGDNIQFSLLAIVDALYQKASDEMEFIKRERAAIERKLGDGWETTVDQELLQSAKFAFGSEGFEKTYALDFGARKMQRDIEIMDMDHDTLVLAWETTVRNAMRAKIALEDEISKGERANDDHTRRTFDYEPFFREFIWRLHNEGLLSNLLDPSGKKRDSKIKKAIGKGQ